MNNDYPYMCLYKDPVYFTSEETEQWRTDYMECIEPDEYNEYEFYEWMNRMAYDYLDDDRMNMKCSPYANRPCVITGKLGLWNGRPDIKPVVMNDLMGAIDECICTDYCSYSKVELIDGRIEIDVSHHDGTNHFTISLLNKKGINAGEFADLSKESYHKKIKGWLF